LILKNIYINNSYPLYYAVLEGRKEVARELINLHADINITPTHEAPLDIAVQREHVQITSDLFLHSAKPKHYSIVELYLKSRRQEIKDILNGITWSQIRVIWIGNKKEDKSYCNLALLPKDILTMIIKIIPTIPMNIKKYGYCSCKKTTCSTDSCKCHKANIRCNGCRCITCENKI